MSHKKVIAALALSLCLVSSNQFTFAQEAAAGSATAPAAAKKSRVGVIHLADTLVERPESFSLSLSTITSGGAKNPALSTLIATLNLAAKDPNLSGILLDLSSFSLTLNQAQEIGALLTNLRKAGKRVAIYAAEYDTPTYALASYADTIVMPENGDMLIPGVGMQMVFFAGTLEKLHMSADFVQIGKFKGAEEPYTRKSASPEYRAQIEKLVDGMYSQLVTMIATNRPNLKPDDVKKLIDEGWLTGKKAKEAGLIDQTLTRDKLEDWVTSQFPGTTTLVDDYGSPKKESIDFSSPFALLSLIGGGDKPRGSSSPAIAVLYATGEITGDSTSNEDSTEVITPATIRKAVQAALDDPHVRAIVLRVDSPGGSATASDEIWSVLKEAGKRKPLTVSMGHLAASGGYYISCAGRHITADPGTITGSIGVVGGKVVLKGALDWAGLNIEPVDKGAHAEMLSMLRPFSDDERAFIKKSMEDVYGVFTSRVAAARGDKVAHLDEVAQGRLFTGEQAKEVGLVDDVGTLNDTIKAAAKSVGLGDNYQVIILPEPKTLADVLRDSFADAKMPMITGDVSAMNAMINALPGEVRTPTRQALHMLNELQSEHVMLTMPAGLVESQGKH
ncbi:MAG TPA: signal peptide peptidase SppA [Phycisphaerae bacterium]